MDGHAPAPVPPEHGKAPAPVAVTVRIAPYRGPRDDLEELFALAEDSPPALASYLHAGRVLAAWAGDLLVGHLQLVAAGDRRTAEIKNMAVLPDHQGRGIGRALVGAALELTRAEGFDTMSVATAAADIGNLRFYQLLGFRMSAIERDAFTPETGYPAGLRIDGIELRDRVWLTYSLKPPS
jgi:GNAT superfamily N-acetyltransferase